MIMVKSESAVLGGDTGFNLDGAWPTPQEMKAQLVTFAGEIKRVACIVTDVARGFFSYDQIADAIVRSDKHTLGSEIVENLDRNDFNSAMNSIYTIDQIFDGEDLRQGFLVDLTKNMQLAIYYLASSVTAGFSRAGLSLAGEFAGKVAAALGLEIKSTLATEGHATVTFFDHVEGIVG